MRLFLTFLILILAGCTTNQWNEKLSTPAERALGLKAIASFRSGNVDAVKGQMEPQLFAQTFALKDKIKATFPQNGEPSLVTVGSNTMAAGGNSVTTKALNYEVGSGNKWAFIQIILREAGGRDEVVGWHVNPANVQPTAAENFDFVGKGIVHYLWILAMVASFAMTVTAFVLAIRSKGIRHRWWWIVGSLVGLVQFSLNWSTGAWSVRPIAFMFFGGASMKASPFDPWILSFSLPIFAIVFLFRRSQLLADASQNEADEAF